MTIDELIAALEAATGPDRGLDKSIADLVGEVVMPWKADQHAWMTKIGGKWVSVTRPNLRLLSTGHRYIPRFTESLDAAVSLVPEGCFWALTMKGVHWPGFDACCEYEDGRMRWYRGATPAIALCIAALKARKP